MKTAHGSGDAALDSELYAVTCEEVVRGFLTGPCEPADLDRELGCWLPARRFGVRQGQKTRPVDDFSEAGVNCAFESTETVAPADLDFIAAGLRAHMAATLDLFEMSGVKATLEQRPKRHADFANQKILCRLWDLEKAYRQLASAPKHRSLAVIAVWSPKAKKLEYYKLAALPFGASASVLGFNWTSHALCSCLVEIFFVGASYFYDDFTVLEFEPLVQSAGFVVNEFSHCLVGA